MTLTFNKTIAYSFVVPIYYDSHLAEEFAQQVDKVFQTYLDMQAIEECVELIFVNDGSSLDDEIQLEKVAQSFPFVKVITLSRNFGQHIAITAGYQFASGEFVGMLNVDMQEHPSEIPKFLDKLRTGNCDIVYGLRDSRQSSTSDKFTSAIFNFILNKLTRSDTPLNIATIRFMNRKFLDAYNQLTEKTRYLPGLEYWLGFNKDYVEVSHLPREKGKSSYTFWKRWGMAINTILSFSDFPLKVTSIIGFFIGFTGFLLVLFLILSKLFFAEVQVGYTSTISIMVMLGGVQIMVIGLSGIYIGRVLSEVQNRPLYVIKNKVNFNV